MKMGDMVIGIVGGGVVGQATARSFLEHVKEVRVYDIDLIRRTNDFDSTMSADIVFLCLPTPERTEAKTSTMLGLPFGSCNTDHIEILCQEIQHAQQTLILRSTVPIGTTKRLRELYDLPNLVHSPEFLTARCSMVDAQIPARMVLGAPDDCLGASRLLSLYSQRWPHVTNHWLTSDESEAVKLFQNGFFAVKVAYWNEVYQLAEKLGLDWRAVQEAILCDGRIHPSHTQVPGPDGLPGFGGACLPKDLANLFNCQRVAETLGHVTAGALATNKAIRKGG